MEKEEVTTKTFTAMIENWILAILWILVALKSGWK